MSTLLPWSSKACPSGGAALSLLALACAPGCLALVDADFDDATLVGESTTSSGTVCEPDSVEACYDGPPDTEGVGICKAGTRTCLSDGSGFGACEEQVLPGIECGVDAVDESCDGRTGAHLWSKELGGPGIERVQAMAVAPDGSAVLTGYTLGPFSADGSPVEPNIFVIKVDAAGEVVWAKSFGPSYGAHGESVALDDAGDVVLLAFIKAPTSFGGSTLELPAGGDRDVLVKLRGEDGSHVWSQLVGSGEHDTGNVAVAASGDRIVVTGSYWNDLVWPDGPPLGGPGQQMFVSVLDGDGKHLHSHKYGPSAYPARVAMGPDGEIFVLGNVGPVDDANLGGGALAKGTNYLVKLTKDGEHVWSRGLGTGTDVYVGRGLTVLADGTAVVAVPFYGTLVAGRHTLVADGLALDIGVVAFGPGGDPIWARRVGGPGFDVPGGIAATDDGGVVIGGAFEGEIDVGADVCPVTSHWPPAGDLGSARFDAFLLRLDGAGEPLWIHAFGDADDSGDGGTTWRGEVIRSVGVAADGSVIVAGELDGAADWGGGPIHAPGNGSLVVARYSR